jgi:1-aminocyclopropane-1-carboxylate deaminase/D-cysteine desulfhydrase-like pyridoxal-dependent ACC family enzyme
VSEPALFRARPWLHELPHRSLGDFPTPVERVEGLLPRNVELWVKREDRSGAIYGGNKVRKLEFLLADAERHQRTRVFTMGGWGSNHALATARYARCLGMKCTLALFPQPMNDPVRAQLARDLDAGAEVHQLSNVAFVAPHWLKAAMDPATGIVPAGGSSVLGSIGWASGADEIREQIASQELPRPHVVYTALGSCGTVAGLLAGFAGLPHAPDEICAVRVVPWIVGNAHTTHTLEEGVLRRLWGDASPSRVALRIEHGQIGRGYGHPTAAALAAVEAAAGAGLRLETTYTGKVMAQLLADATSGNLDGKRVLFIHSYSSV